MGRVAGDPCEGIGALAVWIVTLNCLKTASEISYSFPSVTKWLRLDLDSMSMFQLFL